MARDGDVVKVRLGVGAELLGRRRGALRRGGRLARAARETRRAEVLSIAFSQGFSDEFPPEVMDEADACRRCTSPSEEATRREPADLRTLPLVTIDGEDARDFDDAVYAEHARASGWRLVVAIADVTHYVREGTRAGRGGAPPRDVGVPAGPRAADAPGAAVATASARCKPDEDRLCMVADMVFDARRPARLATSSTRR